jgi:hypothetical protein
MNRSFFLSLLLMKFILSGAQPDSPYKIKQLKWGLDYQVYMQLTNDSSLQIPLENLFHSQPLDNVSGKPDFTYYPVNFDSSFISEMKQKYANTDFTIDVPLVEKDPITLFASLNKSIGGGWIHFINCTLYALETRELDLKSPLLKRPVSRWKPQPKTESYKRTHHWKYYFPVRQKEAQREYFLRKKDNKLNDLTSVPKEFIDLFLHTNQHQYNKMIRKKQYHQTAKIDLIKIMLGSNYIGTPQISYIKSRVLKSVTKYNLRQMPTVLIFDEYQAAVSLTLSESGYIVDHVVFKNEDSLSADEVMQRQEFIGKMIDKINGDNKIAFQKKLKDYYIQPAK